MKKLVLLACVALLFSSCSKTFYQVYTMTPTQPMATANNSLIYENADCRISYNFWSEKGNPGFDVYNKTNKNIYVHLPETFFVKNGKALDYYLDREFSQSPGEMPKVNQPADGTALLGIWTPDGSLTTTRYKKMKGVTTASSVKEKPTIIIPPHSYKIISEYAMLNQVIQNCEKRQQFPKTEALRINFDRKTTPLTFRNVIAYSFDIDGDDMKYIQNEFWMANLTNYKDKTAGKVVKRDECGKKSSVKVRKFDSYAPNKFYNSYTGMPSMGYPRDPGKLVY